MPRSFWLTPTILVILIQVLGRCKSAAVPTQLCCYWEPSNHGGVFTIRTDQRSSHTGQRELTSTTTISRQPPNDWQDQRRRQEIEDQRRRQEIEDQRRRQREEEERRRLERDRQQKLELELRIRQENEWRIREAEERRIEEEKRRIEAQKRIEEQNRIQELRRAEEQRRVIEAKRMEDERRRQRENQLRMEEANRRREEEKRRNEEELERRRQQDELKRQEEQRRLQEERRRREEEERRRRYDEEGRRNEEEQRRRDEDGHRPTGGSQSCPCAMVCSGQNCRCPCEDTPVVYINRTDSSGSRPHECVPDRDHDIIAPRPDTRPAPPPVVWDQLAPTPVTRPNPEFACQRTRLACGPICCSTDSSCAPTNPGSPQTCCIVIQLCPNPSGLGY